MRLLIILSLLLVGLFVPTMAGASAPQLTRIQFAAGATSWHLGDQAIGTNILQEYILKANQGQYLSVMLSEFPESGISMLIYGAKDGVVLLNSGEFYGGYLPSTQDYIIRVTNPGVATKYNLNVTIPSRVQFARGGYSAMVTGAVAPNQSVDYILGARKGQTMTVTVSGAVGLTIYGVDGQPLKRADVGDASWSGVLPATQDYFIVVVSHSQSNVNYSLYVSIV